MIQTTQPLLSLDQTGYIMGDLAIRYHEDMLPFSDWNIFELQSYIKNLPYRDDPADMEFVSRPAICMHNPNIPFDCDDRAVCIGAYCELKNIPFRFVAVCEEPNADFHHVYCEIVLDGKWIECDCTYPYHEIGQKKIDVTKRKIIFERTKVPTLQNTPKLNGVLGDIGSFVYRKTGEIKDSVVDLPSNVYDKVSDSAGSLIDDPLGALYRTGGRLTDNTIDIGKSVGSIGLDVVTLDWNEAGRDLATGMDRITNLAPSGMSDIIDTVTVSSITQDRETMGSIASVVGPVAMVFIAPQISSSLSSGLSSAGLNINPDTITIVQRGVVGAKSAYDAGLKAKNEYEKSKENEKTASTNANPNNDKSMLDLQIAQENTQKALENASKANAETLKKIEIALQAKDTTDTEKQILQQTKAELTKTDNSSLMLFAGLGIVAYFLMNGNND